jgi:hypothetical protein
MSFSDDTLDPSNHKHEMTRDELLKTFDDIVLKMRIIIQHKNEDYAKNDNALKNLQRLGFGGIISRLMDKGDRLENLIQRGKSGNSETIEDTCIDSANYAILFLIMYYESRK